MFGDFHPICVILLIIRILHKILVRRLNAIVNNEFQEGFKRGNSTSENIMLLQAIMKTSSTRKTTTYIASLNFKKVLDSVNHTMRLGILEDLGLSEGFVHYCRNLYQRVRLMLESDWFAQGRGVLQRDPLSPILFNIMVDYILEGLNKEICIRFGEEMV